MVPTITRIRKDLRNKGLVFRTLDAENIIIHEDGFYRSISAQTEEGDKTLIFIAKEWREVKNIDFES